LKGIRSTRYNPSRLNLTNKFIQGGFGVAPNAGSAISAFNGASVSLVQWLGFCSHAEQNFIDFASTWAPGQDLANPDQWSAPILLALKQAHKVLLTDFGCQEWSTDGPAPASAVPQIEGSSPNPAADARSLHLATSSHL